MFDMQQAMDAADARQERLRQRDDAEAAFYELEAIARYEEAGGPHQRGLTLLRRERPWLFGKTVDEFERDGDDAATRLRREGLEPAPVETFGWVPGDAA